MPFPVMELSTISRWVGNRNEGDAVEVDDTRLLLLVLILPFVGSAIAAFLPQRGRDVAASLTGFNALAGAAMIASLYPIVSTGRVARFEISWLPALDLNLTLRLDGFTWLFAMLVLIRSEEHTSELQSLMRISYAVFCLKKKNN